MRFIWLAAVAQPVSCCCPAAHALPALSTCLQWAAHPPAAPLMRCACPCPCLEDMDILPCVRYSHPTALQLACCLNAVILHAGRGHPDVWAVPAAHPPASEREGLCHP